MNNDGEAVTSDPLPYGTEVTLSEATPSPVAGGTWTGHAFDQDSFTIGDETTFAVELTNSIEKDLGGFSVQKDVTGSGAPLVGDDTEFTVHYSYPAGEWYEAGEGTLTVTPGGTASVGDLPAGATVTLTEATPKDPKNGHWVAAQFVDGNVVTIGKDEVVEVGLENQVVLGIGGFGIVKEVDGSGRDLVDPDTVFAVDYEYDAGPGFEAGRGSLEVRADGGLVTVDALPAGAEVRLSERDPAEVDGGTWTEHEFSTQTVTVGSDEVVEVTLTNTIDADDVASGILPSAGARFTALALLIALALLGAGAWVLHAGRSRREA